MPGFRIFCLSVCYPIACPTRTQYRANGAVWRGFIWT